MWGIEGMRMLGTQSTGDDMSRAGRKRKHQKQHSGVPIVTEPTERNRSPNEVARSQPHRMRLYEDVCHDARAATSFGQLNIIGAIPGDLYAAGTRLAGIVRRWREVIDAPRMAGSIAGIGLPGARTPAEIEDAAQRKVDHEKAMGVLAMVSRSAKATTLWVVVEGGRVPAGGFRGLMDGLRALRDVGSRNISDCG